MNGFQSSNRNSGGKKASVRKTPVPDRSSSEKFSDKSASLKSVENNQNYQI